MNKAKLKQLRELAAELPIIFNATHEVHIRTGKELIEEDNIHELPDGTKIDPEAKYDQNMPVFIAANHYRALKKIYKDFGNQGVIKYTAQVFAAEELKQSEQN